MEKLKALWRGELPLQEAFWSWAVIGGLLVNVTTSVLFLVLIMREQTVLAFVIGYAVSIPYNIAASVGVWRSAARSPGPKLQADMARMATLILMIVLSLT